MGGSRSDSRNGCGGESDRTSPADIDCVGPIEASPDRAPSWKKSETIPPTTTDDKSASMNEKWRSAIKGLEIKKPLWMRAEKTHAKTDKTIAENDEDDDDTDRKPSWMQPVTTFSAREERRIRLEHDAERAGGKPKEIKQESLLAQRHIVALLFMEAVYSVGHAIVGSARLGPTGDSSSRGGCSFGLKTITSATVPK